MRDYLWLIAFGGYRRANGIVRVLGRDVAICDPESFKILFDEVIVNETYRFQATSANPLIVDCGSNIGLSIIYFKTVLPDARVVGIEPDPVAFAQLKKNVTVNSLADVTLHNIALAPRSGPITFYFDEARPGALTMSTLKERMSRDAREVSGQPLSTLVDSEIDFLKMDIEGAELGVIEEMSASGALKLVRRMAIEYHHHLVQDEDVLSKMLAILERDGFGYQLETSGLAWPLVDRQFQDLLIRAYRK